MGWVGRDECVYTVLTGAGVDIVLWCRGWRQRARRGEEADGGDYKAKWVWGQRQDLDPLPVIGDVYFGSQL